MENSFIKTFFQSNSTQITLKLVLILILVLLSLIPKLMIIDLVDERKQSGENVKSEVYEGWGKSQLTTGPVLVIPYNDFIKNENENETSTKVKKNLIIYPEKLSTEGQVSTTTKMKNIYSVLLYKSALQIQGQFVIPPSNQLNIPEVNILYNEAYIAIGITDLKGIEDQVNFVWNQKPVSLNPGLVDVHFVYDPLSYDGTIQPKSSPNQNSFKTGLSGLIPLSIDDNTYTFSYNLSLKGSQHLLFAPIGKTTTVHLTSDFPDPKYCGGFLPEHQTNEKGFDAYWKVLEYNKILPSFQKTSNVIDVGNNSFGISFDHLVDHYTIIHRASKYMFLFIVLTFLVVFLTEIVLNQKIHIFQYVLTGLALAIFFILLLSLSEYVGFDVAYIIAAIATISLLFLYSLTMFVQRKSSFLLFSLLVGLFSYVYFIIQLERMALLVGSIGLFFILAATMYATRKVNWYGVNKE
ncbi:MAG: cell envelope integrity protein CreD [Saprospiraceae bacterium]